MGYLYEYFCPNCGYKTCLSDEAELHPVLGWTPKTSLHCLDCRNVFDGEITLLGQEREVARLEEYIKDKTLECPHCESNNIFFWNNNTCPRCANIMKRGEKVDLWDWTYEWSTKVNLKNEMRHLKIGYSKSLFTIAFNDIFEQPGSALVLDKDTFEASSLLKPEDQAIFWILKILDQYAAHPHAMVSKATFYVTLNMNANSNSGDTIQGSKNKIFIFFGFSWNEIANTASADPIYQVGKTIPGYVSYEPGRYKEFNGTDFWGLYDRGVWKGVGV